MKKIILACLFSFIALPVFAQSASVTWNQSEPNAQTFTYTLKVDTLAPVTLVATCNAGVCTAPFAGSTAGTHTYTLAASNQFGYNLCNNWSRCST